MLGLAARDAGSRASELLDLSPGPIALDFDLAVSLRLLEYDNRRERDRFRALGAMITGQDIGEDPDDADAKPATVEVW